MHPKALKDLNVSDAETTVVAKASIWVGRNIIEVVKQCNPSMAGKLSRFAKQLDAIEQLRQV